MVLGIWCFPKVRIYILTEEKMDILNERGRIEFLSTDKGIISLLILNG